MLYFLFFILLLKVRFLCKFGAPIYNAKIVLFENLIKKYSEKSKIAIFVSVCLIFNA